VVATGEAAEALEVGRSVRIDLLISDVVFGAASLAKELRAIQSGLRVLYVFDPDHPDPPDGGDGRFLRKPVSLDELSATVTAVLQAV
jgi:DNA-binding response OmpR family regulator